MTEATVCCVMLTKDRPAMAARAVRSFRAQTYWMKRLLMLDTGTNSAGYYGDDDGVSHQWADLSLQSWTIGRLRNEAIERAGECDIICHFDDDDLSHPNRIAEQVALLQASGADCVGYNECLFWDSTKCQIEVDPSRPGPDGMGCLGIVKSVGEAWLYRCPSPTYGLGSSLCYWRKAWEQKPFADINHGEDMRFITGLKVVGITSLCHPAAISIGPGSVHYFDKEPRMICSIHGQNSSAYNPAGDRNMWKRAAEFDEYCERTMKL